MKITFEITLFKIEQPGGRDGGTLPYLTNRVSFDVDDYWHGVARAIDYGHHLSGEDEDTRVSVRLV